MSWLIDFSCDAAAKSFTFKQYALADKCHSVLGQTVKTAYTDKCVENVPPGLWNKITDFTCCAGEDSCQTGMYLYSNFLKRVMKVIRILSLLLYFTSFKNCDQFNIITFNNPTSLRCASWT